MHLKKIKKYLRGRLARLYVLFMRIKNIWIKVAYLRFVLFRLFVLVKFFLKKKKNALIPSIIILLSALAGVSTITNLDKESKKMEDLYCSIRWSGPNFNSCIFLSLQFWEILKGIQHKFYLLKVHIYIKKLSSIVESLKVK